MTKRILGLLWRISLVSHVPAPLDMAMCFADVLRDYALTNKSPDTRALALDIVSQLVQELNGGDKALPAMRVLHHLISNSGNHAVSPGIYRLMQLSPAPTPSFLKHLALCYNSCCLIANAAVPTHGRIPDMMQLALQLFLDLFMVVCRNHSWMY